MNSHLKLEKIRLSFNIGVLIYFSFLVLLYAFKIESQIFRIIGELLTIPAVFSLIAIPIWALIDNLRKKNENALIYVLTLLVTLITFTVLFFTNSYFK